MAAPSVTRPMTGVAEACLAAGYAHLTFEGDLAAGRDRYEAAYREAERAGDVAAMAEAVLGLAGLGLGEHRTAVAASRLHVRLRHVLARLPDTGTPALRIRVRLAGEADWRTGGHEQILALLGEVEREYEPAVRAEALRFACQCLLGPDHGPRLAALAEELVGTAAQDGVRADLLTGLLYQAVAQCLAGAPEPRHWLGELRAELAPDEHRAIGYAIRAIEVMLAIRAGRLDDAERLAHECAALGRSAGHPDAGGWHAAQLVAIRWYQGRLGEVRPMLEDLVHRPELGGTETVVAAALAVAAAQAGDRRVALRTLATLRRPRLADLPRQGGWLAAMHGFVEAAYRLDLRPAAARAFQLLIPYADLPAMVGPAVSCFGSVRHALGVAALVLGDVDGAVAHLGEAVRRNLALGHWPALDLSRIRLAEALERRGGPGDAEAASHERDQAGEAASPVAAATGRIACRRLGRSWRLALGDRAIDVGHSIGLLHLAVLVANPGAEIAAIDLVAGLDAAGRAARNSAMGGQEVHDRAAAAQYRRRLAELREPSDERDWLVAELANRRPDGRTRAFTDNGERARIAAGRAIRRTLDTIGAADPVIGAHLRATVHTGVRCWYRPA
jgi:hypothetical protein